MSRCYCSARRLITYIARRDSLTKTNSCARVIGRSGTNRSTNGNSRTSDCALFLRTLNTQRRRTIERRTTQTKTQTTTALKRKLVAMANTNTNDEQLNAKIAVLRGIPDSTERTIFDNIIEKKWSSDIIYEDELCLCFRDINPVAKKHFLVIPKIKAGLSQLSKAKEEHKDILGHLLFVAKECAKTEQMEEKGFRIVINDGVDACQSVYHLHLHVIGGEGLTWPPGVNGQLPPSSSR
jgi:diadenosine tetraphosphate (Ap4A) HIT family hydrolase